MDSFRLNNNLKAQNFPIIKLDHLIYFKFFNLYFWNNNFK